MLGHSSGKGDSYDGHYHRLAHHPQPCDDVLTIAEFSVTGYSQEPGGWAEGREGGIRAGSTSQTEHQQLASMPQGPRCQVLWQSMPHTASLHISCNPVYRWGNRGSEKDTNPLKVAQLSSTKARTQSEARKTPEDLWLDKSTNLQPGFHLPTRHLSTPTTA